MDLDTGLPQERPRYDGEDTRPTSSKELYGWYSYGWASEVFVICGVGRQPRGILMVVPDRSHSYRLVHPDYSGAVGARARRPPIRP